MAPSLIFRHSDPVLVTTTSPAGDDPSVDPDPDAQATTSIAPLSYHLEGNEKQGIVTPCAAPDIREISSTVNPIPQSNPTASPVIVVSDNLLVYPVLCLSPMMTLARCKTKSCLLHRLT